MDIYYEDKDIALINGDCIAVMDELIESKRMVDTSIVDIPYGNVSKHGAERAKYAGQLRKIDKGKADIVTFDETEFCERLAKITNNSIYIFCGIDQVATIYNYFKDDLKKDFMARMCVWHKTNPAPSNGQHMFLSATEFVVFAKRRRTMFNEHCAHNVFNFPAGRSKLHPTEKPQEILKYFIETSSNEGDLIFDCCSGSGSTGVASLGLGRKFLGVELSEEFCEVQKKRFEEIV